MKKKVEGEIALVTGGTSGIGLGTAKLFHAEGARVIVTGRNRATLENARANLRGIAEVVFLRLRGTQQRSKTSSPAWPRNMARSTSCF